MLTNKWPSCANSLPFQLARQVKSRSASTRSAKRWAPLKISWWSWLASTTDGDGRYDQVACRRVYFELSSTITGTFFFSWVQLENLESEERTLVAHALLSAAFINFLSCATEDIRKEALCRWLGQMEPQRGDENESKKASFCLKSFLTDEQELMQWRSEGLASDDLAVENALAIVHVNASLIPQKRWILIPFFRK